MMTVFRRVSATALSVAILITFGTTASYADSSFDDSIAGEVGLSDPYESTAHDLSADESANTIDTPQPTAVNIKTYARARVDLPHWKDTGGFGEIAGHGWWDTVGTTHPVNRAQVQNTLWVWDGQWYVVKSSEWDWYYPNGGAGKRSNVHVPCKTGKEVRWANQSKLWVGDHATTGVSESIEKNHFCYPWK